MNGIVAQRHKMRKNREKNLPKRKGEHERTKTIKKQKSKQKIEKKSIKKIDTH